MAYRNGAPPNFLNTAIFLSSGEADTIATPAHHERVKESIRATGFRKVRLENFDGAHVVHQPHVGEALGWFTSEFAARSGTSPLQKSEFDKFFKKKP